MTDSGMLKASGYTTSQFNIIGEDGLRIEFQYRSGEINNFAEYEHIPYDIREGKETVIGEEYNAIRSVLADKEKVSTEIYENVYNPYLTQVYNYNRRIELGLPVGAKPTLNKADFPKLTPDEFNLITAEGLFKLYSDIHKK